MPRLLLLLFLVPKLIYAQSFNSYKADVFDFQIPDSLESRSFDYLNEKFYESLDNSPKAKIFAISIIKNARIKNDSLKIAQGFFNLSLVSGDSLEISCLKIAENYAQNVKNKVFPAIIYYNMGERLFQNANYKLALDYFFKSLHSAGANENLVLAQDSKFQIASLKSRIGKPKEALKIFKEYYEYLMSEDSEYPKDYYYELIALFAIADSYSKLRLLDQATDTNTKGIHKSLENSDNEMYHYFVMNEGVNLFFKEEYKQSIDSISKSLPIITSLDDKSNEIFARYYLGQGFYKEKQLNKAIDEFRKIDSLYSDYKDLFPEIRNSYKILIEDSKNTGDQEKQLYYLNRLIKVDSVLNSNFSYINEKIIKDFDTKNIISQKEKLISRLNQKNSFKAKSIITLFLLVLLLFSLFYINYKRKKIYQKRFEKLINDKQTNESIPMEGNKKNFQISSILSEEVVDLMVTELKKFETNKGYLNKDISITSLSKEINTNPKYLSIYVNHYMDKKFTDYINDLRINEMVRLLKTNSKIRKYTIKAISELVGFKNPVSFSQAFQKKTGLKPSFFIKQLINQDLKTNTPNSTKNS